MALSTSELSAVVRPVLVFQPPWRADPEIETALDAAIGAEKDAPSRPEMIRWIITAWLMRKGYLKK